MLGAAGTSLASEALKPIVGRARCPQRAASVGTRPTRASISDLGRRGGDTAPYLHVPLTHEAYVWQRAWTTPVRDAIAQHASRFSGLTVLSAEVSWKGKQPQVVRVPLDYTVLTNVHCPVGLAFRIGPCPVSVAADNATTVFLTDVAASLIAEARSHCLAPRELQIDFDCAESKLDGYRAWVEDFRRKVAPLPVSRSMTAASSALWRLSRA